MQKFKDLLPFALTAILSILLTLFIEHGFLNTRRSLADEIYVVDLKRIVETYRIKALVSKKDGKNILDDAQAYYTNLLKLLKDYNKLIIISDAVVMPAPGMRDITDEVIRKTIPEIEDKKGR